MVLCCLPAFESGPLITFCGGGAGSNALLQSVYSPEYLR
ncbi:hypothetical protein C1G87_1563 [Dehalococcoides mccartyi]|uniref:Uncharacterized protein n=1 Tax=Dehalococcoides mccartyi TaxID=61435 RepID=A0A328EJN5_9CHLR|nr:hypothetical protein C1G87_1563 [Dehalococcoides mccartyi]